MTLAELIRQIQAVAPHAMLDEAANGEVVVYTGLAVPPDADWSHDDTPIEPLAQ
jgi:hypothetical protein